MLGFEFGICENIFAVYLFMNGPYICGHPRFLLCSQNVNFPRQFDIEVMYCKSRMTIGKTLSQPGLIQLRLIDKNLSDKN